MTKFTAALPRRQCARALGDDRARSRRVRTDAAIAAVMNNYVKPGEPGCTVGVLEGGALTHAGAFGTCGRRARQAARLARGLQPRLGLEAVHRFRAPAARAAGQAEARRPGREVPAGTRGERPGRDAAHLLHHTGGLRDYIEMIYMNGPRRRRRHDHPRDRAAARAADGAEREARRRIRLQQHRLLPARRRRSRA